MIGVVLSFIAGVTVFYMAVDPTTMEGNPGVGWIALAALAMATGALVLSWLFPRTIGIATVGWIFGSVAGFIGAPIAGHPISMVPMVLHFCLSVFIAHGIRRAMERQGIPV